MGSLSQKGLKSPPCSDLSSSYPWPHSPTAFLSAMRRILQPLQHQRLLQLKEQHQPHQRHQQQRLLQLLQLTLQQPQQTLQPQVIISSVNWLLRILKFVKQRKKEIDSVVNPNPAAAAPAVDPAAAPAAPAASGNFVQILSIDG